MEDLLEYLVRALVDDPDEVSVEPYDEDDGTLVLEVHVGEDDAGKVIGRGGMVLLDWRLGSRVLTSGFRADDHGAHRRLVDAVNAHLPTRPAPSDQEAS